ncbi:peroxide stress protein YaaA [Microtetraspora sp. NBRC 16547]|uniref:YaaA family protein n=1 Tax=Microtetraspora sp. NBRC 16547 TaxID=3030993 RepID=UPI0024A3DF91|nr:peroxide stress protein YaaA [Microtetraspora sp. NBRC 16547]GLX00797.1 UPF0246 protein [Microtetraspora sp. NBRC 16547]
MLILLPPSEGKASRGDGPVLDLDTLGFPELTSPREKVLDALITLCHTSDARAMLGLSEGQQGEIGRNRDLRTAPTLTATELYTGVLYDNLGIATLAPEARRRADERVIVFSGLWGALRLTDRVPPYRLSMARALPPMGGLAAFWRPSLTAALDPLPGLVVDMRSATYAQAWPAGARAVAVRVLKETAGKRTVVSHMAKATRGAVARSLVESSDEPGDPQELAEALRRLGHHTELGPAPRPGKPWSLDIVISS